MLPRWTTEAVDLELSLPFDAALEAVARALCLAAQVTDITAYGEDETSGRLEIAVPSGALGLNPAHVVADVTGSAERSKVHLQARAREGVISQSTARKALDAIRNHLPEHEIRNGVT
jgi:hypothetical protein